MTNHMNYDKNTDCVSVLCSFSNGEELEMINGEGDLPLHVAIKNGLSSITAFFLSLNPTLLYRENATGRTPLEMSRDIYTASCVENAPNVSTTTNYHPGQYDHTSIVHRSAQDFMKQDTGPEESKKRTWEICEGTDHKTENEHSRKRRLVSLYEANEVARRVAGMRTARNGESVTNGGSVVGSSTRDIVSMLLAGDTYSVPDFTSYP
ncbi:hypothetical protein PVAG01_09140 [Phlyctema vagabunda]|uniref:Uncharacterized protein n=1 Tax=Phlyctema vagabunda TaxID=108571 RepID=A0ABR4P6J0_9HELO